MSDPDIHGAGAKSPLRGVALGIDVGNARVGVAVSDPGARTAIPLRTLKRDLKKNFDVRQLGHEVRERGAVVAYVGLPLTMNGGESASTAMARDYAHTLAAHLQHGDTGCEVRLIDERLTSATARRNLAEAGVSAKDFKKSIDQLAATEILQQALDFQKRHHRPAGTPIVLAAGAVDNPQQQKDGSDDEAHATSGRASE
ncbi:Holliday junction resolvase RuvX [Haematomicrobium sanguinis]|uniref:Holliday junction resolvase RuvX n=1 Tax=Haematomicrobium sanguinis TaxID=479106 RepID=UPI000B2462C4|nr:Holliday junction resolvase RuvX [Haematomicrobium sanguinis]